MSLIFTVPTRLRGIERAIAVSGQTKLFLKQGSARECFAGDLAKPGNLRTRGEEMQDRRLSKREREILELAANGLFDKQIAAELGIALGSVRTYWERIRTKLDVKSRSHAVSRWARGEFGGPGTNGKGSPLLDLFLSSVFTHALIILNSDGIFTHWNPGVQKLFGYSQSEFVGKSFEVIFTPEDRACGRADEQLRQARELGPVREDHWHCQKNGDKIWLRGVLYALWDHGLAGYGKIVEIGEPVAAIS